MFHFSNKNTNANNIMKKHRNIHLIATGTNNLLPILFTKANQCLIVRVYRKQVDSKKNWQYNRATPFCHDEHCFDVLSWLPDHSSHDPYHHNLHHHPSDHPHPHHGVYLMGGVYTVLWCWSGAASRQPEKKKKLQNCPRLNLNWFYIILDICEN